MLRWLIALFLLAAPGVARAEWREAVSKHFIVYSEGSEAELRQATADLEKYDFLLRLMLNAPQDHPIRLKIYLLEDQEAVAGSLGQNPYSGVAGYYSASPRGSLAVGMRKELDWATVDGFTAQVVLFHEYAHHLMLQYYAAAYPGWYVEGFAEYYGTTKIIPNGYEVGQMAAYRRASFHDRDTWELLTKKPMVASEEEVSANSRARSAKLRVARRRMAEER